MVYDWPVWKTWQALGYGWSLVARYLALDDEDRRILPLWILRPVGPPVSKNWLALLEQRWAVSPQPEEGPESPLLLEEKAGF